MTPLRILGCVLAALLACGRAEAQGRCELQNLGVLNVIWENNRPLVQIRANGQRPYALVDTGAAVTSLFSDGAERLGVSAHTLTQNGFTGIGGVAALGVVRVPGFAIVGDRTVDIRVSVIGSHRPGSYTSSGEPDVVMVLGRDVLAMTDIEFDFAGGVIRRFRTRGACGETGLAYWGDYIDVPMARRGSSGSDTSLFATAKLNDREVRALLDTGAPVSLVSLTTARQIGAEFLDDTERQVGGVGPRSVRSQLARFTSFSLGGETIRNARLRATDFGRRDGLADVDMILGADFFRTHRVLVAYSQRKIYFSYVGGPVFQVVGDAVLPGDYDEEAEPTTAASYVDRGSSRVLAGNSTGALADFEHAISLDPQLSAAYAARGDLLERQGNIEAAIADRDQAARLEPQNISFQNARCWLRAIAGVELELARSACDAALAISPGSAAVLDSRGLVGLKQGRNQEAWTDYNAALERYPESAHHLFGRGIAALRLGRTAEGQADLRLAVSGDPHIAETYARYGVRPPD